MRDFFIKSFEMIINVVVIIMSIGVVIAGLATMFGAGMGMGGGAGFLSGLFVLVVGGVYVLFFGGLMYLGLGIYQNTRRSAEAMERMSANR